ncbi:MAG: alpha/beta fold hydrolase, partial [Phycisphaerales bacterium]|nr:alpha/beta fold hydrolase [Phycisphaerales bacterium]
MDPRFLKLPRSLQKLSVTTTLNGVPALVARPKGEELTPVVIWMHGRTVYKELDPGRYQRWVRAGIAAVALDLPGHGQRFDPVFQQPTKTLEVIEQGANEINGVLVAMREMGGFDMDRVAIGGMSAGGMVTLHRLCSPHRFVAACLEGTTGNLHDLYFPPENERGRPWPVTHDPEDVRRVDPMSHLAAFRPIPVLALHNEGDAMVPISTQRVFLDRLREHYADEGADPAMIELHTFTDTGAPAEHAGFGRFANEA